MFDNSVFRHRTYSILVNIGSALTYAFTHIYCVKTQRIWSRICGLGNDSVRKLTFNFRREFWGEPESREMGEREFFKNADKSTTVLCWKYRRNTSCSNKKWIFYTMTYVGTEYLFVLFIREICCYGICFLL